jgi:hypothetical protein
VHCSAAERAEDGAACGVACLLFAGVGVLGLATGQSERRDHGDSNQFAHFGFPFAGAMCFGLMRRQSLTGS